MVWEMFIQGLCSSLDPGSIKSNNLISSKFTNSGYLQKDPFCPSHHFIRLSGLELLAAVPEAGWKALRRAPLRPWHPSFRVIRVSNSAHFPLGETLHPIASKMPGDFFSFHWCF